MSIGLTTRLLVTLLTFHCVRLEPHSVPKCDNLSRHEKTRPETVTNKKKWYKKKIKKALLFDQRNITPDAELVAWNNLIERRL